MTAQVTSEPYDYRSDWSPSSGAGMRFSTPDGDTSVWVDDTRDQEVEFTEVSVRGLQEAREFHALLGAALAYAEEARPDPAAACPAVPWHLEVVPDGWSGTLEIDPARTGEYDGMAVPIVSWHIPVYQVGSLASALELLGDIADRLHAHTGELPLAWSNEVAALRLALDHMVDTGRAQRRTDDNGETWVEPVEQGQQS